MTIDEWRMVELASLQRFECLMTIDEWRIMEVALLRRLIIIKMDGIP